MSKKSIRLEFESDQLNQIYKAAELDQRSGKKFMEMAVIAATLQILNKKHK